MKLSEFVATTLIDIKQGIRTANEECLTKEGKRLGHDNPPFGMIADSKNGQEIDFDVAVTVSRENTKAGKAGISIAVAQLGGKISDSGKQENISRIKFTIRPRTDLV